MLEEQTDEQIVARAQRFYDEHLRSELEPAQNGQFVAVQADGDQHAVAEDPMLAFDELRARGCREPFVLLRVGSRWTFEMLAAG